MPKRHVNIPIFIPHLGCPNDCIFCNQRSISGKRMFDKESVKSEIEKSLLTVSADTDAEIAFFGGSFTGIDRELMIYLLKTAKEFMDGGRVKSVRLSTRPDYIDNEILTILSAYGVENIELGIQSMDDVVLATAKRGHLSEDSVKACLLIKEHGFKLIGQMMTGLPFSTYEAEIKTAEKICELGADGARIYPTMVFRDTELESMVLKGIYNPPTLEDTVFRTANVLEVFVRNDVPVIRIGLHSGETLYSEDGISMGEYHPAMGELVEGELYYRTIKNQIEKNTVNNKILCVQVPKGELSKVIGHKKINRNRLMSEYGFSDIVFKEREDLKKYDCRIVSEQF